MLSSLYAQVFPRKKKIDLGVLTGVISTCGSIERLSRDHLLPQIFLRRLKLTNAPYVCVIVFAIIGLAMFAIVDANMTILSDQFAMTFLLVMGLFALSNISLKFNRDRLVRQPRVPLSIVVLRAHHRFGDNSGKYRHVTLYGGVFCRVFSRCPGWDDV